MQLCNVLLLSFKKHPDIVGFIQNNCPVWGQILMNDHVITISAVFTDNVTSRLCRIYHASLTKTLRKARQKIAASEPAGRGLGLLFVRHSEQISQLLSNTFHAHWQQQKVLVVWQFSQ